MGEMTTEGSQLSAGIDLSQFYQVFFEEAGENLDRMEQLLLELNIEAADDEELNAIFRCAHSIKGGAATFGFADVAELTHQMETLLDKLRRHELQPTPAMVDVLLASGDALRAQLARHQTGQGDEVDTGDLLFNIRAMVAADAAAIPLPTQATRTTAPPVEELPQAVAAPAEASAVQQAPAASQPAPSGERTLELEVGPLADPSQADNLQELFKEIVGLGTIVPLDGGQAQNGIRRFRVVTTSTESELLDLFTFHVSREQVKFKPLAGGDAAGQAPAAAPAPAQDPGYGFFENAPGAPAQASDPGYGFFDNAPGAPQGAGAGTRAPAAKPATRPVAKVEPKHGAALDSTTIRVSVEKVDQLINLVGELVITQAMLAQNSRQLDPVLHQQLLAGLTDLDRNTRDLQEAVMSIRMIPMSTVFSRFPRMLRDLAGKLGKKVELITHGEATELDKGLIEKITDPLTHLVRNACDHGIEPPQERLARASPSTAPSPCRPPTRAARSSSRCATTAAAFRARSCSRRPASEGCTRPTA